MLLRHTLPISQQEGDRMVRVLRSNTLIKEVESAFLIPVINDAKDAMRDLLKVIG